MKAIIGLLFVLYCVAADNSQPKNVEQSKQEKRSLSHGALDIGLPATSFESAPSYGPPTSFGSASYGPSVSYGSSASFGPGPSVVSNEIPAPIPSSAVLPGAVEGAVLSGPASTVGISTNTNTLTTINQKVPVPVPVYRAVPVDRPVPYPVVRNVPVQVPV